MGSPGAGQLKLGVWLTSCRVGGSGSGEVAKDALGNDVKASSWLATHQPGDRSLSQGLKVSPSFRLLSWCLKAAHGICGKAAALLYFSAGLMPLEDMPHVRLA